MEMDLTLPSSSLEPPRAHIPVGEKLYAKIFGVDSESYFHIGFISSTTQEEYTELYAAMEKCCSRADCLTNLQVRAGMYCIVEYGGRRGGLLVRGKITDVLPNEQVRCHLIDDYLDVQVQRAQLFPINDDVLKFPKFSLQCKLDEMDCFTGRPYLRTFFDKYMRSEWKTDVRRCVVQIVDQRRETPLVQLTSHQGQNIAHRLQEYIPDAGRMEYPDPLVPTKINITHVNEFGQVWFQFWGKEQLHQVIRRALDRFNPRTNLGYKVSPEDLNTWKKYYFFGPGAISIAMHPADGKFYRVQIARLNEDGKTADARFLDHGYCDVVNVNYVFAAHLVDPNLAFIPPQCLPIKFISAGDNPGHFDINRFYNCIENEPVEISLTDTTFTKVGFAGRGMIIPEADILVKARSMSPDHPGHSLAYEETQAEQSKGISKLVEDQKTNNSSPPAGVEDFTKDVFEPLSVPDVPVNGGSTCNGYYNFSYNDGSTTVTPRKQKIKTTTVSSSVSSPPYPGRAPVVPEWRRRDDSVDETPAGVEQGDWVTNAMRQLQLLESLVTRGLPVPTTKLVRRCH